VVSGGTDRPGGPRARERNRPNLLPLKRSGRNLGCGNNTKKENGKATFNAVSVQVLKR